MISFWEAGKDLPDEMRLAYYDALLQYGFTQSVPEDIHPVAKALIISNKPTLDVSWVRFSAKSGKTKQKQTENKSTSKQNQIEKNGGKEEGRRKKEKGERKISPPNPPLRGDVNVISKNENKTISKKGTQIPEKDFFDMQYAKDFHMEPDLAFEIFSDWAKAKGQLYKDWNLAWKKACREWLPEKVVQAKANQSRANTASEERTLDPQWYEDWAAFHAGERGDTPPNKEDYYQ